MAYPGFDPKDWLDSMGLLPQGAPGDVSAPGVAAPTVDDMSLEERYRAKLAELDNTTERPGDAPLGVSNAQQIMAVLGDMVYQAGKGINTPRSRFTERMLARADRKQDKANRRNERDWQARERQRVMKVGAEARQLEQQLTRQQQLGDREAAQARQDELERKRRQHDAEEADLDLAARAMFFGVNPEDYDTSTREGRLAYRAAIGAAERAEKDRLQGKEVSEFARRISEEHLMGFRNYLMGDKTEGNPGLEARLAAAETPEDKAAVAAEFRRNVSENRAHIKDPEMLEYFDGLVRQYLRVLNNAGKKIDEELENKKNQYSQYNPSYPPSAVGERFLSIVDPSFGPG